MVLGFSLNVSRNHVGLFQESGTFLGSVLGSSRVVKNLTSIYDAVYFSEYKY